MWIAWISIVLACAGGGPLARAQDAAAPLADRAAVEDVSALLEPIRARAKLPALAVLVTRGRAPIAQGVCGVRKLGSDAPATLEDSWHLGSCTKSLTATLLAILVEDGELAWDTTPGDVFEDVEQQAGWREVTLEQLLAHRGGVPARLDPEGEWVSVNMQGGSPREQREAVVRDLLARAPESAPGTRFVYSNGGFSLAAAMAERVCDAAWEDLMRERLFEPLGMRTAGFGSPGSATGVDQPWGHRPDGTPDRTDNPEAVAPAGRIHCSLADWAKYVAVHTGGWRTDRGAGEWLLAPATIARLHEPYSADEPERYGFGWAIDADVWGPVPEGTGPVLVHSGSNDRWYSGVWASTERDGAVLVACNQGGEAAAKARDEVMRLLIGQFFGK